MNIELWIAAAIVLIILGVVFYKRFVKRPQPINSAVSLAAIGSSLKTHLESIVADAKVEAAKGIADLRAELHPAALAASVAVPPPSAAPTAEPSAGSGGTAPIAAQQSDPVAAAHAALDSAIATHQAAIATATAQKAALTAAVASAVSAAAP